MGASKLEKETAGLLAAAAEQIGERVSSLIGADVKFAPKGTALQAAGEFAARVRRKVVALLLDSAADEGRAVVIVRLPEAVLFAATLLMVPATQIKEMVRSGEMDKDTADAFTEIANIVYGAVDDLMVGRASERGKLRNEGVQLVDAAREGDLAPVWPDAEAFVCEMAVTFPGHDAGTAFLVLQPSLAAHILGIAQETEAAEGAGARRTVLLHGTDAGLLKGVREYFEEKGLGTSQTREPEEAIAQIGKTPLLLVVEFPGGTDARAARVCRAAAEGDHPIPVVGIARNPTRETILGARKAGVRAFLVHPCTPEALRTKMDPFLVF